MCVLVHFQSHLNTRRYQVPSINRTKCSVSRARVPLCRTIEGRNCINSDSVTCERFPWHGVHPRAFHFLPQARVGLTSNGGRLPWRWLTDWWRINVTNARHCVLAEWGGGMKRHSSLPEPGNQGHLFKGYALKYILAAVCDKKKKKKYSLQLKFQIKGYKDASHSFDSNQTRSISCGARTEHTSWTELTAARCPTVNNATEVEENNGRDT